LGKIRKKRINEETINAIKAGNSTACEIQEYLNISYRAVSARLKKLDDEGIIERVLQSKGRKGRFYKITLEKEI